MAHDDLEIPRQLLALKPASDLQSVSASRLARHGTEVLQTVLTSSQPLEVKVQGLGAMVTLSRQQYDDMIALIGHLQTRDKVDDFDAMLQQRFDELVAQMQQPGAARASRDVLFGETEQLNAHFKPGSTETEF